jgi:RNA polymerase sigma factor (sigma-70 family)
MVNAGDPPRRALIPPGINPPPAESSQEGVPRHPEGRLEPNELERFEAIVLPHLDAAYTLARYLTRNDHDAQDVVQDASLRALQHFGGFRGAGVGDGRAWLLAIVRNAAYTWQRRRRGAALTTEFDEELHSDAVAGDHPAAALERAGARQSLQQALDRLRPEFREVIVLRELEGLSYKEISDVTGAPVGTVMSRLARARQRLQEALRAGEER